MKKQIRRNLIECVSMKYVVQLISSLVFHRPYCSFEATLLCVRLASQEGEGLKSQSPHLLFEGFGKCYEGYTAARGLESLCQVLPPSRSLSAALAWEGPASRFIPISWAAALEMLPDL